MNHTYLHEKHAELIGSFNYDSHPMGVFISSIAALSTFHPEANPSLTSNDLYKDKSAMDKQIVRLLGKAPTIAAASFRTRIGRPLNQPQV
jgi:citrate synthase